MEKKKERRNLDVRVGVAGFLFFDKHFIHLLKYLIDV